MKKCSNCGRAGVFSIVAIISTVGITKRLQKSSAAVPFCDACLQELIDRLSSEPLSDRVNNAYTWVNLRLRERITMSKPPQESGHDHPVIE
jgi:hypothetical protein